MKYTVSVDGHAAQIDLTINASARTFIGAIDSPDYGPGTITEGVIAANGTLTGKVTLDGYNADFTASQAADGISGTIEYKSWLIHLTKSFTGTVVAA